MRAGDHQEPLDHRSVARFNPLPQQYGLEEMRLRRAHAAAFVAQVLLSQGILAQSLALGEYSGSIQGNGPGGDVFHAPIRLTIERVAGDRFEGNVWVGIRNCLRDVPVRGRVIGETVRVRALDKQNNCGVHWDLKKDGDRLEWTGPRGHYVQLSK